MRLLVDVGHPGHVHFYKNPILRWVEDGHEVLVAARDKDLTYYLLKSYSIDHVKIGKSKSGIIGKGLDLLVKDIRLYNVARKFNPDVLTGIFSPYVSHVGFLLNRPSILFNDTEMVRFEGLVTPFASVICTPTNFKLDIGKKHVRYNGYHELAYLHPRYFRPDKSVLDELGIDGERYAVIRLISWSAYHDIGLRGLDPTSLLDLIKTLEKYCRVFITSEQTLDGKLEKYRLKVPPEKIHSVLHFADLYLGEGGTMAAEAAILGTPAVHVEAAKNGMPTGESSGNFVELSSKYGLLFYYADTNEALKKAVEILEEDNPGKWQKRRRKLLEDKIDVTSWVVDFVQRYPESFYELVQ